ncbi:uncharacterized protein [Palaemon carinicauda]|uniref:uncharacterized protein n=1 Tax=Palaemon carinicauda TaxID=392227 RepID=UPI0035B5A1DC
MKILNPQEEERQIRKDERKLRLAQEEEARRREAALQEVELQKKLTEIELSKTRETANIQHKTKEEERNLPEKFDFNKVKKLIPTIDEKKPKVFFDTLEDTATSLEWPAEHWVMLIRNGFKGKAAYVSSQMITVKDYQILKKAILDAYSITIEGYRQSFRNSQKSPTQTFVEICDTKVRQFQKWIDKAGIKEFESLKSLVIMEEFLRKVPFNIANYILDKEETDLMKAASLADDYFLRHKSYKPAHYKMTFFTDRFGTCCKRAGHLIEKCPDPQSRKSEVKEHKPGKKQDSKKTMHVTVPTPDLDSFKPYTCQGSVNGKPVSCPRDTGSSQIIINLPPQELTMKQEYVAVTDLTSTKTLPLAEVTLQCPYYTGKASVAVSNKSLPHPSIQVLIVPKKNKTLKTSKVEKAWELVNLSKVKFQQLQSNDPSLTSYWKRVENPSDNPKTPYFYTDHGLLFRYFRSSRAPVIPRGMTVYQLLFPATLVPPLLDLAHTSESHLGVNKICHRVLQDFFWPGIKKDIKEYIMSCHQCQVTCRPNESIIRAPLQPILVTKQPFEKIIIDCVGPMPKTRKGNEYLLTVLCPTTRYPIAMPIKNINAKTIIGQLVKVFTTFGFPKILQCDRGTNFTSKLFQQSMQEFNIHNVYASPYHPQTNGALERVHQTIKNLLRKYMEETSQSWDENLDLFMYMLRSVPNDSTGVSPFELMFGRKPRTTLSMVKENFIHNKEEDTTTLLAYMKELKEKFLSMYNFANENLLISQEKMSNLYNKKTKLREFNIGDKVQVYHPIPGAPLTLDSQEVDEETPSEDNLVYWKDLLNSEVLESLPSYLAKIPPNHRKTLTKLLLEYSDVCSDQLKVSDTIKHDIILEPGTTPIRQPYYRVVGRRLESLRKEVQYLLDNNLAEPSMSPWASPCILVPKANGQLRICTDYRKLNKVTIKDSFPLPRINDISDNIGKAKILTQIDLMKGYYQVPLTEKTKEISAFTTPFGLFSYTVLPFGLTNSPANFQRMMSNIITGLPNTYVYLDDVVIASENWDEHLHLLRQLLEPFRKAKITINLVKSTFDRAEVTYLGHRIGNGHIAPKEANILSLKKFPIPSNKKKKKKDLPWYDILLFVRDFSSFAAPLYTPEINTIFQKLKHILICKPILKAPDFKKDFCLQVDASATGYGAVLLQTSTPIIPDEDITLDSLLPIAYYSGYFRGAQTRWATIEKELYAIIAALQNFSPYLEGHQKVIIYTDHRLLVYLERSRLQNQKLLRWSYHLTRFNVELRTIKGINNSIADALSRFPRTSAE